MIAADWCWTKARDSFPRYYYIPCRCKLFCLKQKITIRHLDRCRHLHRWQLSTPSPACWLVESTGRSIGRACGGCADCYATGAAPIGPPARARRFPLGSKGSKPGDFVLSRYFGSFSPEASPLNIHSQHSPRLAH